MESKEQRLERMYLKITKGKRSGPDLLHLPPVIGTMVDAEGLERRVYQTRPALVDQTGQGFFIAGLPKQPAEIPETGFWDMPTFSLTDIQ